MKRELPHKIMANSLAYFKFRKSLEREIQNYWSLSAASEVAKLHLKSLNTEPRMKEIFGARSPFSRINITWDAYIKHLSIAVEHCRENALVNFVTEFEVYLFEIFSRIIYVKPECLDESGTSNEKGIQLDTKRIASGMRETNFRLWTSNEITDKTIRNKSHSEILKKLARYGKFNLDPISNEIEEWNNWTYVRNSIVHTGRKVSEDLNRVWPERFISVGTGLDVSEDELMGMQSLAQKIIRHIDGYITKNIIKDKDGCILVRELFVRYGIENNKKIRSIVNQVLQQEFAIWQVEKQLSLQRKKNLPVDEIDFNGLISFIDLDSI